MVNCTRANSSSLKESNFLRRFAFIPIFTISREDVGGKSIKTLHLQISSEIQVTFLFHYINLYVKLFSTYFFSKVPAHDKKKHCSIVFTKNEHTR